MPTLVPTHTVHVKRDHPNGVKDANGNVRQVTVRPPLGQPFDFTDEEVEHVRAHRDAGLREPVNEGGDENQLREMNEEVEKEARDAAEFAAKTGGAQNDAAVTARQGAINRKVGKKPVKDPEILDNQLLAEDTGDEEL